MKERILERCVPAVESLVLKYNYGNMNEDARSCGLLSVWECLLKSEQEGMTNEDEIYGRCVIWARNAILDEKYKIKKQVYSEDIIENAFSDLDDAILMQEISKELSKKQQEVLELLIYGLTREEIKEKLNIKDRILRRHIMNITNVIKNHAK